MKKMSKNLQSALYYLQQNPEESKSSVASMFKTDRHKMAPYLNGEKDFQKFTIEDQSNPDSNYIYYFSESELEGIKYYLEHHEESYTKIREKYPALPTSKTSLKRQLEILGEENFIKAAPRYTYKKDIFKKIETEEAAYWLGFILADGCLVQDARLSINLAEKDKEHLKKFCRFLQMPENEINAIIKNTVGGAYTKDNPTCALNICSKEIVQDLKEKNIFAAKSGKEIPYICETPQLEKAYIRGIFDGDGYIRSTQSGLGLVGSFEICSYVQNYINKYIVDTSSNHIREHGTIWKFELSNRDFTKKILDFLYKDATIYLDRKFNLYKEIYQ